MKNSKKGSAVPLIIAVVAVLALGALFLHLNKRVISSSTGNTIAVSDTSRTSSFHSDMYTFSNNVFNDLNYGFSLKVSDGYWCSGYIGDKENEYPFLNPEMRCVKNGNTYNKEERIDTEAITLSLTKIPASYTEAQVPSIYGESDFLEYGKEGIFKDYKPLVGKFTTFAGQPAYYSEYEEPSDSDYEIYKHPVTVMEYVFPYHGYYYVLAAETVASNFAAVQDELKSVEGSFTFSSR